MSAPGRGFWPLRDLPVVLWLVGVAVVAVVHQAVPAPRWLLIHLLLLGAVTHAILVWSRYFTDALLRTPPRPGDRRLQSVRLVLLNVGALAVVTGVVGAFWPLTVAGASAVGGAVVWHGGDLAVRLRRALPGRFRVTVRYYVAAACLLPVGATLGTLLARGLGAAHAQTTLAHAVLNVLGWMGLTVVGTLLTLWPTMLHTRVAEDAERVARRALPVLVGSVLVVATGALAGLRLVAALGLAGYVAGLVLVGGVLVRTARARPPAAYPTWSVAAAMLWLIGCVTAAAVLVGTADSWSEAGTRFGWLTPFLAAGFGAQVLLGALSYLVPVALGGGAGPVRAANAALDRGAPLRIVVVNAALLVCALPVPSIVRVLCSLLVLAGLAAFVPLLFGAIRAARRARTAGAGVAAASGAAGAGVAGAGGAEEGVARDDANAGRRQPRLAPGALIARPAGQLSGLAVVGLVAVVLAVAGGVALDPSALPAARGLGAADAAAAAEVATGRTTTVQIRAVDMRFEPSTIEVPLGDRLVVELTNADDDAVHDLVLDTGPGTDRLAPGESTVLDAGVVGRDLTGWCSVVGHRQMGMVLEVRVTGDGGAVQAEGPGHDPEHDPEHGPDHDGAGDEPSAAEALDFAAAPEASFAAHDAVLPAVPDGTVHRHTLTVSELEREVAPGVTQRLWTFGGSAPGPVLHGRVGDVFEVTLVNDGTIGHSIDFHAGSLAPDEPMRTIPPGESLVYRFTATMAGIWMYHCSTMPMSAHIANGMFGAVVIEPRDLAPVDRSYLLVQSELYLGPQGGTVDLAGLAAERPDAVVFNGYAGQYDHRPLQARVGERVRIWVLDAGPNRGTSFHVVGGQFDTVYAEGRHLLRPGQGGSQALALAPAQGGFVELTFPEAGSYPFVSHVMVDAERGAHGLIRVDR